jgi:hypothetical protein
MLLGVALWCSVLCNSISFILSINHISANYGGSIFNIVVLPLISLIYFNSTNRRNAKTFLIIGILYEASAIFNLIFIQKGELNTNTLIALSLIVIVYALYYFYWLLQALPTEKLHKLPMFWVNTGYIIYYAGNLFLFIFASYLVKVLNNNLLIYWTMHNCMAIVEAILIITGVSMDLRNEKSSHSRS